jgi:hypothetical protein
MLWFALSDSVSCLIHLHNYGAVGFVFVVVVFVIVLAVVSNVSSAINESCINKFVWKYRHK